MDSVLCQLRERYSDHFADVKKLSLLVPGIGIHQNPERTAQMMCEAVDFYATALGREKLASELNSWNCKWWNTVQDDTALPTWVSEQFLNGTSAQYRLCSAILLKLYKS